VKTWKITVEYDGTKYRGWQEQRNARTIMGELRKALEEYFGSEVDLQGAGRTDAGVHAVAQVAHIRVNTTRRRSVEEMRRALNDSLPADISVLEVEEAPGTFHARHDAHTRSYVYQIATRKLAFSKKHVWWIKEPLDTALMSRAAKMLEGRHDFRCFRAVDPSKPDDSTIVVVESAEIDTQDDLILFRIEASHFLWRMVRRIVGVLVKLGLHEIRLEDFEKLLAGRCEPGLDVAAWTAPSAGLFLESVKYPHTRSRTRSIDSGSRRPI
jgi:tRNA pseudouridine38-40 synthase